MLFIGMRLIMVIGICAVPVVPFILTRLLTMVVLAKQFRLVERVKFEVRMEAYNAPNAFTPAAPNTSVGSARFGKAIGPLAGTSGRQVQLSGRFTF